MPLFLYLCIYFAFYVNTIIYSHVTTDREDGGKGKVSHEASLTTPYKSSKDALLAIERAQKGHLYTFGERSRGLRPGGSHFYTIQPSLGSPQIFNRARSNCPCSMDFHSVDPSNLGSPRDISEMGFGGGFHLCLSPP